VGTNFTDLATTDFVTAATLNARLEQLGQAIGDGVSIRVTSGEAIAAREVVFISTGYSGGTAGRAYRANASNTWSSTAGFVIGCAAGSIGSGAAGAVQVAGIVDGFSGLTAGAVYYLSTTAGAITATPPTNVVMVGIALSSTQLLLNSRGSQVAVS